MSVVRYFYYLYENGTTLRDTGTVVLSLGYPPSAIAEISANGEW